jgi:[ribosomal protein S5]-alanine N-acetyltransferase
MFQKSKPLLWGERVFLRLPTIDDVDSIVLFYRNNAAHLESVSPPKESNFYTIEFWQSKISNIERDFIGDRACNFWIFDFNSEPIGFINFSSFIRSGFQACFLGYGLAEARQRKGFMIEALALAISFVFNELNMHRIMANYLPNNERSAKLLRKLNFVVEGYAKDYLFIGDRWHDHVLTSLTNHDWTPRF